MSIIEIANISKNYNNNIVLSNINYLFKSHFTYLLVGANGSGKSTLVKIILSLVKPTTGFVILKDNKIGYVPEKAIFPEIITVYEFLYNLALIRKMNKNTIKRIINGLLDDWELDGNKRMDKLSKGMMQKTLIIQALIHNPNIYVFDEPLNGLDSKSQEKFMNYIKQLQLQRKTIIIVTHYIDYYQNIADKIIFIINGGFDEESN